MCVRRRPSPEPRPRARLSHRPRHEPVQRRARCGLLGRLPSGCDATRKAPFRYACEGQVGGHLPWGLIACAAASMGTKGRLPRARSTRRSLGHQPDETLKLTGSGGLPPAADRAAVDVAPPTPRRVKSTGNRTGVSQPPYLSRRHDSDRTSGECIWLLARLALEWYTSSSAPGVRQSNEEIQEAWQPSIWRAFSGLTNKYGAVFPPSRGPRTLPGSTSLMRAGA
jgi:hypothetical protein